MLFLMFALVNLGIVWGNSIVYAAFLEQSGLSGLPWIFIFSAALSIVAVALYTPFVDRVSNDLLLDIIFGVEAGGIILGLLLLKAGHSNAAYAFLYVIGLAWLAVAGPHLITYVNQFYTIQTAKRMMPVIIAGYRVGAIAGGLSVFLFNRLFGDPRSLLIAWLAAHTAVIILALLTSRLRQSKSSAAPLAKQRVSYLENLKEGFTYTLQSPYLRWMVAGTLLLTLLMPLLEYRASDLFLQAYRHSPNPTASISNFVGYLRGAGNIIVLPMLLFGVNRLIARLGVANAALIFPLSNLFIVLGLMGLQVALGVGGTSFAGDAAALIAASAAYLDRNVFRLTFWYPVEGLLYNAIPLRVKGRARAFVNGWITPIGVLLAGALLLLPVASGVWFVSALMLALAAAYLGSILTVRKLYSRALIKMLEEEDYAFLFAREATDLSFSDPTALASLERRLKQSKDPGFSLFIARLIAQIGGPAAAPILIDAVTSAQSPEAQAALIDLMTATDMRGQAIDQCFRSFLRHADGRVRRAALAGLAALHGAERPEIQRLALTALQDSNPETQLEAFSILAQSGNFYQLRPALDALNRLLNANDLAAQLRGVKILGQIANFRAMQTIITYLEHPADALRLEAVQAFVALPDKIILTKAHAPQTIDLMAKRLTDPLERIRSLALKALTRIDDSAARQAMLSALGDSSPEIRAAAVDSLARAGKAAIPLLQPQLQAKDPLRRKMAAVTLSRIDRRKFGPLVNEYISRNLQEIYRHHLDLQALARCKRSGGMTLLQDALQEEAQHALDEIFYLLATQRGRKAINVLLDSLRSPEARARSNALEALETFTGAQTTELLAPLFDPDVSPEHLARLGEQTWGLAPSDANTVINRFIADSRDAWRRAMALYALSAFSGQPVSGQLVSGQPVSGQLVSGQRSAVGGQLSEEEIAMLSGIERMIFLKKVPFFQDITIEQLKSLAALCEEEMFEEDQRIFNQGDPGGALYIIVSGKVGIEQKAKRKGSSVRLATLGPNTYFGEMTLFDNSARSAAALALQDTLTLSLRREPLLALLRQNPNLALKLINVLSRRLRDANRQIAARSRAKPRALHKLYDALDE